MEAEPPDLGENEASKASSPAASEAASSDPASSSVQMQQTSIDEPRATKTGGKGKTKAKRRRTVKELEAQLEKERQRADDYRVRLAYLQAEHENYIKSVERQKALMVQQANRDLVLKLLPVLDDLERALAMLPVIEVNEPSIEGLNMVVENFRSALRSVGVEPIECEGRPFDPLRHEVIARIETGEHPPNTVIEELRRGYTLHGALLRPSLVKIAIPPTQQDTQKEQAEGAQSVQPAEEPAQQPVQASSPSQPSQTSGQYAQGREEIAAGGQEKDGNQAESKPKT